MASEEEEDLHLAVEELRRLDRHSKIMSDFGRLRRLPGLTDFPSFQDNLGIENTIYPRKVGLTKVKLGSKIVSEEEEDLRRAVEDNNETLVLDLLDNGIDVNSKDKDGKTALFIAAKKGKLKMVSILLRHGAEVNTKCNTGETPLYEACEDGHEHVVQELIKHNADVNMTNECGRTPLHAAAWNESQSLITLLINFGAYVNTLDNGGDTPLHEACEFGYSHVVQELIKHKADVNMTNERGQTPLHAATRQRSHQSLILLLINSGAHVNTPDNNGDTPLHTACEFGREQRVIDLIKLKVDLNIRNKKGETPLLIALREKNNSIAKLLIAFGANIKTMDRYNSTPLLFACKRGDNNMVQILLELKADVNMQNIIGETPLHVALKRNDNSLAQMLVDSGAKINLADKNGETLLHRAVSRREKLEVLVLLQLGANVDISNKKGETALEIAVKLQDTEMEAILKNGKEKTTRDQSFKRNHEDVTALLSQLKKHKGFEDLDLPRNTAEIKSGINSLHELLSQEIKYQQVILKNLLAEASRIICIIIMIELKRQRKEKGPIWEDLEELLDRGHTETEVEDLERKLKLLESDVIKARDVNTKFLPEMEQIMEDLQTCFAEMKRVTSTVENFKNVKELDRLIKMINFKLSEPITKFFWLIHVLEEKKSYINFQWEKFKKFEETLQARINSVENLQKELDSINTEVNPQDHASFINDFAGQELFQTTLSELEKRLRQITGSLYQSSLPNQAQIETFKSEIITLKSDMLKCFGLLPIFKSHSNPAQITETGDTSKLIEIFQNQMAQFQKRSYDITRNLAYGHNDIKTHEVKIKDLKDDMLKSIILPPVVITAYPLITTSDQKREEDNETQRDKERDEDDDAQSDEKKDQGDDTQSDEERDQGDDTQSDEERDESDDTQSDEERDEGDDTQSDEERDEGDDTQSDEERDEGDDTQSDEERDEGDDTQSDEERDEGDDTQSDEGDENGNTKRETQQEEESLNEELLRNAREGNADHVRMLIEKGANPNVQDENGMTPLVLAAANSHLTVVQVLLRLLEERKRKDAKKGDKDMGKKNAKREVREGGRHQNLSKQDAEWLKSKLLMTAREGNADDIRILIEKGANPNVQDENGMTPLILATKNGHKKVVEVLLRLREERKTKINIDKMDNIGNSALHYSVLHEQRAIVWLLVQNKASLKNRNDEDNTAMDIAEQRGYEEIWNILDVFNHLDETLQINQKLVTVKTIINADRVKINQRSTSNSATGSGSTIISRSSINSSSISCAPNTYKQSSGPQSFFNSTWNFNLFKRHF